MSDDNYYKVGGSLEYQHPTYVVRRADCDLYDGLRKGEFCYVLNSRQMGKSSLRVQMMKKLKEQGIKCASIDMTRIGSHVTTQEWYGGVVSELLRGFSLSRKVNFSSWWREREFLSPLQRFRELIEDVLLVELSENIVIFLDEIDSILKIKFKDDFFAFIRACYNQRVDNPEYNRLTFCLLGVATASDLIADKQRTPFNVGRAIELTGFKVEEAKLSLIEGLAQKVYNPVQVVEEVLAWTGGQPFLTQKLCQLVLENAETRKPKIEQLVQKHIINNWEASDEPEHLRTIRDRLLKDEKRAGSLLGLYQQILQQGEVAADDSLEQTELRLSGLVVRQQGKLRVYNRIYEFVFNLSWIEKELASLRPYAKTLAAWLTSNCQDESQLLCGQALQDAQAWAEGKSLSTQDYQFLGASQKKTNEILNQIVWELVSPLSVDEISPQVAALVERLRQVSGDDSLTLLKIKTGSTILVLQGSQEGFDQIRSLLSRGQLTEILGIPVQDVRHAASAHHTTVPMGRKFNVEGSSQQVITEVIPQDFYIGNQKQKAKIVSNQVGSSGSGDIPDVIDPIDNIADEPDVPCLLEEVKRWVQTDPTGELTSIHVSKHPEVTCQILILRRLPPETSWQELATEFNLSVSTLSSFYQRHCLPRLRKFGESEGYL